MIRYFEKFERWRYKNVAAAGFSFVVVLTFLIVADNRNYRWDAAQYFSLANVFIADGRFSLLNYPVHLRGSIFPLLLFPFNWLSELVFGDALYGWRVFIAVLSAGFTVAFPAIFKGLGRINALPLPIIAIAFIWFGLLLAPLADLVSLFLLIFALALIRSAYEKLGGGGGTISLLLIGQFLLGGALLYAAYNTRTIYQFAIVGLLLIIFVQRKTGRQKGRLVTANDFAVVAIVAGLLLGSVPQVIINHNHTGELTMTAINSEAAAQWRGGQQSLNVFQLEHGLRLNLYETWNGDDGLAARVGYVNHSGIHILNEAYFSGISLPLGSLGDYFRAVARFPLEALGTYVRHLIVLLNPISGGGYIYSRTNMRFVYTMLNYTMLFVVFGWLKRSFLDGTLREIRQKVDTKERATSLICLLTILLPFIFILPGAVEERFAIGFWVIIYGVIFYCIDFRQEWAKYRARPFAHGFFYLAGFGVFIAILTEIYVHSSHGFLPILNLQ